MSKPKPLPEIEKCICGGKTEVGEYIGYYVGCCECLMAGPQRKTKRGAIETFNRLVRGYREVK